jgi:polysaccharide export outer membrane protein
MKAVKLLKNIGLVLSFGLIFSLTIFAQVENPKTRERVTKSEDKTDVKTETKTEEVKPVETSTIEKAALTDTPTGDEQAVLTYYNNYLKEYRLGPNDVISVEVFGQCPDYCKTGITVPPTARISYPLVREGVLVGGKTVEQVADEITKKLDEYIIDPKVTVTLDKAMSARYSVMGKVSAPGIRILDRKVSLYEAVIEAGGITKEGNKKKISLVRFDPQGKLVRQEVNLADIESGKAPMIYLNPGDQVFVPGKGFTIDTIFKTLEKVSIVRLLFGSPF